MKILSVVNTNEGRFLLSKLGKKPENKIVFINENSFVESLGGNEYQATFFSRNPIEKIFQPIVDKIDIADEYKTIENKREAFLHYSGLESKNHKYPQINLIVSTLNPVSGANSPVDGFAARTGQDEVWSSMRGGNGVTDSDTATDDQHMFLDTTSNTDQFANMYRSFFGFNTATLTPNSIISAATFSTYITAVTNTFDVLTMALYLGTLASNSAVAAADYQGTVGNTTLQSDTTIAIASISTSAFSDFVLNTAGLDNINTSSVTIFSIKSTADATNTSPTWSNGVTDDVIGSYADTGTNLPKLVVTYILQGGGFLNNFI